MGDITQLLHAARDGHGPALDRVFAQVYPALRSLAANRLAGERDERTLSATALVHEAYLRLTDAAALELRDRRHFFACAARAMRRILVDHARARGAVKRGGPLDPVTLSAAEAAVAVAPATDLLDVDAALSRLDEIDPALRELVELRLFAGLTLEELAETSDRSLRSVNRDWQRARALLLAQFD